MTTENTTEGTTTVETPVENSNGAAPAAKPAKKVAKKATKKAVAKKAVKGTKKAAKKATTERKPREPRDPNQLNKPQVRILKLLAKGKPLTRSQISEKAPVDNAFCTTYIGSLDEEKRLANDEKRGVKSLLTHKYVKAEQHEGEEVTYSITATGKTALAKAEAAE